MLKSTRQLGSFPAPGSTQARQASNTRSALKATPDWGVVHPSQLTSWHVELAVYWMAPECCRGVICGGCRPQPPAIATAEGCR